VECNPEKLVVVRPQKGECFVAAANRFNSKEMQKYNNEEIDDWRAGERYLTAINALKMNSDSFSLGLAKDILSGKHGFMCQYDRKTNADTVWSVIYDLGNSQIWRVEGNPGRKSFKEDSRAYKIFSKQL
jgi:predicted choloylglycine hydrolase